MYDYLSYHATNENILYFFKKGDYIKGHIMSELLRALKIIKPALDKESPKLLTP
jgi:hypothetical protein